MCMCVAAIMIATQINVTNTKRLTTNGRLVNDYNLFGLLGTMVLDDESLSLFWF